MINFEIIRDAKVLGLPTSFEFTDFADCLIYELHPEIGVNRACWQGWEAFVRTCKNLSPLIYFKNLHIFATAYHTKEDKNPIVNKFSYLLLWGFLFIDTFIPNKSGVSTKLTGGCDKPNNLNFLLSLKSQGATATPCTTLTLKASRSFADEQTVKDVRKLESKGCARNTEKYLRFLNLNLKSLVQRFTLKGYATNTKAIISTQTGMLE